MKRLGSLVAVALALAPLTVPAETLVVNDASQLKWAVQNGKLWLRILNAIDPSWQRCCYIYYVDLSTDEGRTKFSAFLTKNASGQPLQLHHADNSTAAPNWIEAVGVW